MQNVIEKEMITAGFRFDVLNVPAITFLIPGVVAALTGGRCCSARRRMPSPRMSLRADKQRLTRI
ncbi:MAG: hypothetical protein U0936_19020 [Planctomycetaceae bacterium]